MARPKGGRQEGKIIEVLKRKRTTFIGTFSKGKDIAFVIPDDPSIIVDFYIPKGQDKNARDKDKVVVELLDWPATAKSPFGRINTVLGKSGSNEVEMQSILVEQGFKLHFPDKVLQEVAAIPTEISTEEIKQRRDFRGIPTFTIDPDDAKDFDDALSIKKLKENLWEVGVHIADVSHYVKEGSALDEEAQFRATSVYLVDRVLPMFPEKISNEICSLRPNEDKLCYAAVFTINNKAEIKDSWFGRTVIHSDQRFTYGSAQEVLDEGEHEFKVEINRLNELAKIMRAQRLSEGSINFETREVNFELDDKSKPVGLVVKERKDAHLLIEEFMLLANKHIAKYLGDQGEGKSSNRSIYRVHDLPDLEKLMDFARFAGKFGYKLDFTNPKNISKSLNEFMDEVHGKPEQNILENLAIRSMSKAIYDNENIGHYGLGFDFYTHFTSPIRRYPDVWIHRLVTRKLNKKKAPTIDIIKRICNHSTDREKAAVEAERASTKMKMAEFMVDQIGNQFRGVISGIKDWGIYVEIVEFNCEGLLPVELLDDDVYVYKERDLAFEGLHSKKIYQLGDPIDIIVKNSDVKTRRIDFKLANTPV